MANSNTEARCCPGESRSFSFRNGGISTEESDVLIASLQSAPDDAKDLGVNDPLTIFRNGVGLRRKYKSTVTTKPAVCKPEHL